MLFTKMANGLIGSLCDCSWSEPSVIIARTAHPGPGMTQNWSHAEFLDAISPFPELIPVLHLIPLKLSTFAFILWKHQNIFRSFSFKNQLN